MNIRNINLNLLITLDALLTERHVSRAADKVFITQPAMSNSLTQLRELFNDQLLVRSGKNMELTPLAIEIAPKIKNILQQIEDTVIHPTVFDPKTAKREFKIGMSDYGEFVLLPALAEKLAKLAPNISLRIIHMNMLNDTAIFTEGKLDLGIGIAAFDSPAIRFEKLFSEDAICAARSDHPTIKKLTAKNYLAAKHLAIAYETSTTITDTTLKESGSARDTVLKVPHILVAMHVLANTPLIATVPKRVALTLQQPLKLAVHKPPFTIPSVTVSQAWHKRFDDDAGHKWLRNLIKEIAQTI
jgi:DNA-binding transcriptional LysR family regulator